MRQAGCAATPPPTFGQIVWQFVGNTAGFGHDMTSDHRPFWKGRFSQTIRDELLFYYSPAGHWHRGLFDGQSIVWTLAGNTSDVPGLNKLTTGHTHLGNDLFAQRAGYGWTGDFDASGYTELVYRQAQTNNFWLLDFRGAVLTGLEVIGPPPPPQVSVPAVVGLALAQAVTAITNASLKADTYALDNSISNQTVVAQDPVAGVKLTAGSHVRIGGLGPLTGVKTLHFYNCSNFKLHLWSSDDGGQSWNDEDYVDPPTADPSQTANCPSKDIDFTKRSSVQVVGVDSQAVPDVSPSDPAFDPLGIVFTTTLPANPNGIEVTAGKSS